MISWACENCLLLHTLTYKPVYKDTLGIHQIKLVIWESPGLRKSCGTAQHAHSSVDLVQDTNRYQRLRLVFNANLEASGAPVHKLDGVLGLDGGNSSTDIFRNHNTMVYQSASHVFTMERVTFHHVVGDQALSRYCNLCYR